jgi:tetraacyldisaccharide 4'-kinase
MELVIHALSLIYRLGSRLRFIGQDLGIVKPARPPLPVVSVGSLGFGGSGKTPLVLELLRYFLERGVRPALVTRGYRGDWEREGGILSEGAGPLGDWRQAGDEAYMAALNLPEAGVYVGRDRLASCRKAVAAGFQVAVLDDGFQHRQLGRDVDIVLFDPAEKIRLRESVSSLRRAHIVLWNPASRDDEEDWKRRLPDAHFFRFEVTSRGLHDTEGGEVLSPSAWQEKRFMAFCGIARPERFTDLLDTLGIRPEPLMTFPDHHPYPAESLERIRRRFESGGADALVTTEKDAVKLTTASIFRDIPLYYLKIALTAEPGFYQAVLSALGSQLRPK